MAASLMLGVLASLQAGDGRIVKAGLLLGSDSAESQSVKRGAALGVKTASRMFRAEVRLVERGQPGQWGVEGNEAAALALEDEVDGMITPSGGKPAHQVLQVAGRTHLPVVSLCADSSVTAAGIPWAARIGPSTEDEARAIFQATKLRAWAAIVPPEREGREALGDLRKAAAQSGAELKETLRAPNDPAELASACSRLARSGVDGVLVWVDRATAERAARQLRSAGFGGVLAGPSRLGSKPFSPGNGFAAASIPISEEFREQFRTEFGEEPDEFAAMAHDAVLLLAKLGQAPAARIGSMGSFEGATGTVRFDGNGNRIAALEARNCPISK